MKEISAERHVIKSQPRESFGKGDCNSASFVNNGAKGNTQPRLNKQNSETGTKLTGSHGISEPLPLAHSRTSSL